MAVNFEELVPANDKEYILNFTANTDETNDSIKFRVGIRNRNGREGGLIFEFSAIEDDMTLKFVGFSLITVTPFALCLLSTTAGFLVVEILECYKASKKARPNGTWQERMQDILNCIGGIKGALKSTVAGALVACAIHA